MVVYNKPGRLVPSRLCTPQGTKSLVLGLVVLVLSHWDTREREREVVGYRDDHYILHEHTFPTQVIYPSSISQQSLSLPSHTHWLPTVADPHHLPQVWFGAAGSTHTTYCKTSLGVKTMNAHAFLNTIDKMYPVVEMKEKYDGDLGSWKRTCPVSHLSVSLCVVCVFV